ncbi:hypothetical protein HK096_011001 [Nowakowskiella sp. JEL0078]|nr:hypothetical protein HK096_011001 [Nowakowskiella sp. JEL0078]
MPTYHGINTAGFLVNRRWAGFFLLVLTVFALSTFHLISLQYNHASLLQEKADEVINKIPIKSNSLIPILETPKVEEKTVPKKVDSPMKENIKEKIVEKIVTVEVVRQPTHPIKYVGPKLNMDQIHKKMAKLLYGPIVAHEDDAEKSMDVPIEHMWQELYVHGTEILDQTWEEGDYGTAGKHLRTFSQLYTLITDRQDLQISLTSLPNFSKTGYLVNQLEQKLFPWLNAKYRSLTALRNSWSGRGIVLTSGRWHFPLALHAIVSLRKVLGVDLPIEIFYSGKGDIENHMAQAYAKIPNVTVIDVENYFDQSAGINGWHVKPFAMLASSFKEIIFLDADVLFLQDPSILFNFKGYKETGTAFFFDRSIGKGIHDTHKWFEGWLKDPTEVARKARFWNHETIHEMESGVVAIDKGRAYMQLLGVCWMNTKQDREVAMKNVHGDKETFWMVAELIRLPYYFVPTYGGTVGYVDKDGYVCGGLYHGDENEQPFWWNGGVLINKHFHLDRYINFTHYAFDRTSDVKWKWESEISPFCLMPKNPKTEIGELSLLDKAEAAEMVEFYKVVQQIGGVEKRWDERYKAV